MMMDLNVHIQHSFQKGQKYDQEYCSLTVIHISSAHVSIANLKNK